MRKKGAKRCELLNAHKGLGENLSKQFLVSFNRLPRSGPQCRAAHTHALTSREYVPRNEPHILYIVENKEARVKNPAKCYCNFYATDHESTSTEYNSQLNKTRKINT